MWLFTIYGFYSVACADGADGQRDPNMMMLRARKQRHLQNLKDKFPALEGEILRSAHSDYRYRLIVPKGTWVPVLGELAQEQTWSNFKSKVWAMRDQAGDDYEAALHKVWETMYELQK